MDVVERKGEIMEKNREGASFEKIGKLFLRVGTCYERKKDFDKALEFFGKAKAENNDKHVRNAIRDCENAKAKHEKEAYVNPELAEEENEKAKAHFQKQEYVEAKKCYDEAVKRNPSEAKFWANRAAALMKLCAYPDAIRDCEECLKLDPKFVKAHARKGQCYAVMKDYNKAVKAFQEGLAVDPNDAACQSGMADINNSLGSREVDEAQVQQAMKDPEIQKI